MKKSSKILIGLAIVIAFVIGFFIGTTVDTSKTDSSNLQGTISRMKNFEKFKVSENDAELRAKFLSDETLLKSYQKFYAYHCNSCTKLSEEIDYAIQVAENEPLFVKKYADAVESIKSYRQALDQLKNELQLAVTALDGIQEEGEADLALVINTANNAATQVTYKNENVLVFVNAIEKFLMGSNPYMFPELIKVHDMLSVNQLILTI